MLTAWQNAKLADPGNISTFGMGVSPLDPAKPAFEFTKSSFTAAGLGCDFGCLISRDLGFVAIATSAIESAGALVDMSNKTGLSTETLQRMSFVAKQSGSDVSAFSDAAFKMGVNIQEGTAPARKAAQDLGLSWTQLRNASPDEQFDLVVRALEAMEDPQRRNADAVALFGKGAKEILPSIVDGYTKVAAQAKVAGDAQVRAVDAAADAWDRFKERTKAAFTNTVGNALLFEEALKKLSQNQIELISDLAANSAEYKKAILETFLAQKDITLKPSAAPAVPESFIEELKKAKAAYAELTGEQRKNIAAAIDLGKSDDEIVNRLGVSDAVLKIFKKNQEEAAAAAKKLGDEIKALKEKVRDIEQGFNRGAIGLEELGQKVPIVFTLTDQIDALGRAGQHAEAALLKMGGALTSGLGSLPSARLVGIGTLPDVSPSGTLNGLEKDAKAASQFGKTLGTLSTSFSELAQVGGPTFDGIARDIGTAVSAAHTFNTALEQIGKDGATSLDKVVGGLSLVGAGITVLGAIGKALNIGGPSKEELQSRKDRDKAFDPFGGTNDKGIQSIEDQLLKLGANADQAQRIVGKLLDTKDPQAFAAAMSKVNAAVNVNATIDRDITGVVGLIGSFQGAGHLIPASMLATIQTLQKMPQLTDAQKASLQGLVDASKPNFDTLEGLAEKYGGTLQGLGPKLAQGQIDHTAQGIYQDFKDLTEAGGEAGNVVGLMQSKLGDLVKQAQDSGGAVPSFLKGILGNFGDTIKDSNGDLIDLTKVTFNDTPTGDGLADMQSKLDGIQGELETDVPNALKSLLQLIPQNPFAGWQIPGLPGTAAPEVFARGGIVPKYLAKGNLINFAPRGTDTVPAMLTPGEMVLTRDQQHALFSGGGVIEIHTTLDVDGREIAKSVTRHQTADLHSRKKLRAV